MIVAHAKTLNTDINIPATKFSTALGKLLVNFQDFFRKFEVNLGHFKAAHFKR